MNMKSNFVKSNIKFWGETRIILGLRKTQGADLLMNKNINPVAPEISIVNIDLAYTVKRIQNLQITET